MKAVLAAICWWPRGHAARPRFEIPALHFGKIASSLCVRKASNTMHCIFCKADSTSSRSVEHVIPESLGNIEHTLRAGVVCNKCNNYFAHSVEEPLLSDPYFREKRFQSIVLSKKGQPPRVLGIHMPGSTAVEVFPNMDGSGISVGVANASDERRWITSLHNTNEGRLIIPKPLHPDEQLMSRFLAKVALECLTLRLVNIEGGQEEITSKVELDPIRNYARRGGSKVWPFHARPLYAHDFVFSGVNGEDYEVLHEWTLLYEDPGTLYLILAIFGVEYAMNMGEPETETYKEWLRKNANRSHLYPRGCAKLRRRS